jgi:hypothetical protein
MRTIRHLAGTAPAYMQCSKDIETIWNTSMDNLLYQQNLGILKTAQTNPLQSNKLTTLKIGNLQPDEDNSHRRNRHNIHSRVQ